MQSTFPGADIGIKPCCVMVVHFRIRKNETFGRGCRKEIPVREPKGGCTDEDMAEKEVKNDLVPDYALCAAFGRMLPAGF